MRYTAAVLAAVLVAACSGGGDLTSANDPTAVGNDKHDHTPKPEPNNHAPVVAADTFHVAAGQTIVISSLLANDSDPDGDPLVVYPASASVAWDATTGHVAYSGNIGSWEQHYTAGVAYGWNPAGGFSFSAAADASGQLVTIPYQAIEDGPSALPSAPVNVLIMVE